MAVVNGGADSADNRDGGERKGDSDIWRRLLREIHAAARIPSRSDVQCNFVSMATLPIVE
jgi:hypothetical protein